jgi:1-phosphofructokinase
MIVTVTPNPSIDRTIALDSPLTRGAVHRVASVSTEPGGKGVNVARALILAGLDAVAVLPAAAGDPLLAALDASGLAYRAITVSAAAVRTNIAVTESDGTTTKLNERGTAVDPAPLDCRVAVDTSDEPLAALAASLERAAPDLIKPNSEELASITGTSAEALEIAAARGDPEPVVAAARKVIDRGARGVLATLGAAGAVLVDQTGSWFATSPPIAVRCTGGAGDSSLAGYLRADVAGADAPEKLRMAVAYGSAAASLPGSALPSPAQVHVNDVRVQPLSHQPVN